MQNYRFGQFFAYLFTKLVRGLIRGGCYNKNEILVEIIGGGLFEGGLIRISTVGVLCFSSFFKRFPTV